MADILEGFQPLHDFCQIRPDPTHKKTSGGILLPNGLHEKIVSGTVLAVGKGRWVGKEFVKTEVKAGQKVVFRSQHSAAQSGLSDNLIMLRETDLLGVKDD